MRCCNSSNCRVARTSAIINSPAGTSGANASSTRRFKPTATCWSTQLEVKTSTNARTPQTKVGLKRRRIGLFTEHLPEYRQPSNQGDCKTLLSFCQVYFTKYLSKIGIMGRGLTRKWARCPPALGERRRTEDEGFPSFVFRPPSNPDQMYGIVYYGDSRPGPSNGQWKKWSPAS